MGTLREMIDGKTLHAENVKADLFDHVKKAAHSKADYDVSKAQLATKLAPMQSLINLSQQMHGPNPQDPSDPFQNPYMQEGMGGPGGTGQGMENQDDLARTGQMVKPQLGQDPNNYLAKQNKGIPGQPNGDGNKKLQTPGAQLNQGKAPQRSTSGQKPGKVSQATDGKPTKKGKSIKVEVSDGDKMAARGTSEGVQKAWDTRGRGKNAAPTMTDPGQAYDYARKTGKAPNFKPTMTDPGQAYDYARKTGKAPNFQPKKQSDPRMDKFDYEQSGRQRAIKDEAKKGVPQGEKIDWRKYAINPDLSASKRARLTAEAIKNGMKRCKTCKNFFNPSHPKAGKSHCPTCKSGSIAAARSAGRKAKSFRASGTSEGVTKSWENRARHTMSVKQGVTRTTHTYVDNGTPGSHPDNPIVNKTGHGDEMQNKWYVGSGGNPYTRIGNELYNRKGLVTEQPSMTAGGPGSGRKSEGESKEENLKYDNPSDQYVNTFFKSPNASPKKTPKGGYDDPMAAGREAFSTTTKKGKKVLTTGDYHNDAGKSMPSVAIGLSAGHARRKKWIAAKTGRPSIGPFPSSLVK